MSYRVLKVRGDYPARQLKANDAKAALYIEQHFNSKLNDREEDADNYACVLVAHNASERSKQIARSYAARAALALSIPNGSVVQVGYGKNGDRNLRFTDMPAVLLEPLFISDLSQAEFAASPTGRDALAQLIVDVVREFVPPGGTVALSAGHKHQDSKNDPGAPAANGRWEADLAEEVIERAAVLLESDEVPPTQREGAVPRGTETDPGVGANVLRSVMSELLAPIKGTVDQTLAIARTTADGVTGLATKVDRLTDDRKRDRQDIDRILEHLGMGAAQ